MGFFMSFHPKRLLSVAAALLGSVGFVGQASADAEIAVKTISGDYSFTGSTYAAITANSSVNFTGNIELNGGGIIPSSLVGGDIYGDCADPNMIFKFGNTESAITANARFVPDAANPTKALYEDLTNIQDFLVFKIPMVHDAIQFLDENDTELSGENFAARVQAVGTASGALQGIDNAETLFHAVVENGAHNKIEASGLKPSAMQLGNAVLEGEEAPTDPVRVLASFGSEGFDEEKETIIPMLVPERQSVSLEGNNRHYKKGKLTTAAGSKTIIANQDAMPASSIDLGEGSALQLDAGGTVIDGQTITCGKGSRVSVGEGKKTEFASGSLFIL